MNFAAFAKFAACTRFALPRLKFPLENCIYLTDK